MSLDKLIVTYIHHYNIIWGISATLETLMLCLFIPPFLLNTVKTRVLFTISIVLPFLECHMLYNM